MPKGLEPSLHNKNELLAKETTQQQKTNPTLVARLQLPQIQSETTMCFSATASFASGAILLFLGLCSVLLIPFMTRTKDDPSTTSSIMTTSQKMALASVAAIPLIFGGHQLSEGFVWTDMENEHAVRCFAYTAYVLWPLYISLSFALVEWTRRPITENHWSYWPQHSTNTEDHDHGVLSVKSRRGILTFHVLLASGFVALVVPEMIRMDPETVRDVNGRLQYEGWGLDNKYLNILCNVIYVYCVVGSLLISSLRYSTVFGALVLASLIATAILWENQYPSTWCFFSAVISSMVIFIVWSELKLYTQQEPEQEEDAGQVTVVTKNPSRNSKHKAVDELAV